MKKGRKRRKKRKNGERGKKGKQNAADYLCFAFGPVHLCR